MAFMHQLRQLRQERGLSQQALADAIFVSRSAVAKWENGLGLPSNVYYIALLHFFNVTESSLAITADDHALIRRRNRRFGKIFSFGGILFLLSGLFGYYFAFVWERPPIMESLPVTIFLRFEIAIRQLIFYIRSYTALENAFFFGGLLILGSILLFCGYDLLLRSKRRLL